MAVPDDIKQALLKTYNVFTVKQIIEVATSHLSHDAYIYGITGRQSLYVLLDKICHAKEGNKVNVTGNNLYDITLSICDELNIPQDPVDIYGVRKYVRLNP